MIEDVNDEIPLFTEREQERVLEGEPLGTVVTRVNAIDRDGTFPNNQVYYYIKSNSDGERFFKINSQTGEISTKAVFDRFVYMLACLVVYGVWLLTAKLLYLLLCS